MIAMPTRLLPLRWRATRSSFCDRRSSAALQRLDPLWDQLFPAEQARVIQLLVERIDVAPDGADIRMRTEGLTKLVADLAAIKPEARRAA